jgi:hypothetical protein
LREREREREREGGGKGGNEEEEEQREGKGEKRTSDIQDLLNLNEINFLTNKTSM